MIHKTYVLKQAQHMYRVMAVKVTMKCRYRNLTTLSVVCEWWPVFLLLKKYLKDYLRSWFKEVWCLFVVTILQHVVWKRISIIHAFNFTFPKKWNRHIYQPACEAFLGCPSSVFVFSLIPKWIPDKIIRKHKRFVNKQSISLEKLQWVLTNRLKDTLKAFDWRQHAEGCQVQRQPLQTQNFIMRKWDCKYTH